MVETQSKLNGGIILRAFEIIVQTAAQYSNNNSVRKRFSRNVLSPGSYR